MTAIKGVASTNTVYGRHACPCRIPTSVSSFQAQEMAPPSFRLENPPKCSGGPSRACDVLKVLPLSPASAAQAIDHEWQRSLQRNDSLELPIGSGYNDPKSDRQVGDSQLPQAGLDLHCLVRWDCRALPGPPPLLQSLRLTLLRAAVSSLAAAWSSGRRS